MRAIFILVAVIVGLSWGGFSLRASNVAASRTCFTLAVFVFLLLAGAFFGLYGV
ncbi:MAG: hypothetical protein ACI8PT_003458 [Gammaproteobacteria bacterium]|jgi:hypothetical protein